MTVRYTREGPVGVADHRPARGPQRAVRGGPRRACGTACAGSSPTTPRVLVLTGAGDRAFCAGGDLKEMADAALEVPPPDFLPQFGRNIDVPKPTIAAVNGVAYAGGFLLAQKCDLVRRRRARRVRDHARCKVGRGAPWAAPLPWLVPPARRAAEILLTGEPVERGAGVRGRAGQPGRPGRRAARARRRSWPSGSPPTRRCRCAAAKTHGVRRRRRDGDARPTRSGRRCTAAATRRRGRARSGRSGPPQWKGR